jgi:hypothetical protein
LLGESIVAIKCTKVLDWGGRIGWTFQLER